MYIQAMVPCRVLVVMQCHQRGDALILLGVVELGMCVYKRDPTVQDRAGVAHATHAGR